MEQNWTDEIDNLKSSLQRQKEKHEHFLLTEHQQEINVLKKQVWIALTV